MNHYLDLRNVYQSPFLDVIHELERLAEGGHYISIFSITPECFAVLRYVHTIFRVLTGSIP